MTPLWHPCFRGRTTTITWPWTPTIRFAVLAIVTALVTIVLKLSAYSLTGSVGLLSDALESVVNLVAAVAVLIALNVAQKDADEEHAFGHTKAEYFSSAFEGALILLAAVSIFVTAIPRLVNPEPLDHLGWGIAVTAVAALLNLAVARKLYAASQSYRSITLEADAKHLMTDVWTSVGVLVGILAVGFSGWIRLDPILALVVAGNIVWTGVSLIRRSMLGLLDTALPADELDAINRVLTEHQTAGPIKTHALRTRQAASRRFVSVHILVPGTWTVEQGHVVAEAIEQDIRSTLPATTVFTHIEPLDNPASWADTELDRSDPVSNA